MTQGKFKVRELSMALMRSARVGLPLGGVVCPFDVLVVPKDIAGMLGGDEIKVMFW